MWRKFLQFVMNRRPTKVYRFDGELWVLVAMGAERPPRLVAVSVGGDVRRLPYEIPLGATQFAIDAVPNRIYVATDMAELYRVEATGADASPK